VVEAVNTRSGNIVIRNLAIRCSFRGRLRGFMFSRRPGNGSAILLLHTGRVHTAWMRFYLDLYFFDASWGLLGSTRAVGPFRLPSSPGGCRHILEVPHTPGSPPLKMALGDRLSIVIRAHLECGNTIPVSASPEKLRAEGEDRP